ncbi:hypothetical protein [Campylobacter showae]|uniref:Uncharacterized protein n=1 Tax=Campylobacter showae CC57C TaxID=1073353 RepID=M3IN51_9BACT|nr:hypothetical protein [Campylobacter showae]EMG31581.1 hypothetical protein H740_00582 [Campylobacter showae CC57C]
MKVRAIDNSGDWQLGHKKGSEAIAQNVKTQILSLYNDWFLDFENGIKWFDYLAKNPNSDKMRDEVKRQILSVEGVSSLEILNINLNERKAVIEVRYRDIYDESQRLYINASE